MRFYKSQKLCYLVRSLKSSQANKSIHISYGVLFDWLFVCFSCVMSFDDTIFIFLMSNKIIPMTSVVHLPWSTLILLKHFIWNTTKVRHFIIWGTLFSLKDSLSCIWKKQNKHTIKLYTTTASNIHCLTLNTKYNLSSSFVAVKGSLKGQGWLQEKGKV